MKEIILWVLLLFIAYKFFRFLFDNWSYKEQLRRQNNGQPKAQYPSLHKPTIFKSYKKSKS